MRAGISCAWPVNSFLKSPSMNSFGSPIDVWCYRAVTEDQIKEQSAWWCLGITGSYYEHYIEHCYFLLYAQSLADIFLVWILYWLFVFLFCSKVSTSFCNSYKVSSKCRITSKTTRTTLEATSISVSVSVSDEKWQFQSSSITKPNRGQLMRMNPKMNHQ